MTCRVVSADSFFINDEGEYVFDASQLPEAHGYCFREFLRALRERHNFVIVDNTNTTAVEIAPYMLAASAFEYEPEIITIMPNGWSDLGQALARNVHGVSSNAIAQQFINIRDRVIPPYWKEAFVAMKSF